jgi:hypothetical protein
MIGRLAAALLGILLLAEQATAQVQQSGTVTIGHVPYWVTNGAIGDGGSSADSPVTSFGVTNNGGAGICVSSDRQSATARNQLCFGASTTGPATISLQNYGSASAQNLEFVINGTVIQIPTGGGNTYILGNPPFTSGDVPCFSGTSGTVIDCGLAVTSGTVTSGVWAGTPIGLTSGGTGATSASAARTNLGLGSIATQSANNVAITGGTVTGLPTPTNATDAAIKSYVDSVATGLNVLPATRLATAAVLPNTPTYSNGTACNGATLTAGSNTTLTVDGTTANLNDVVLVKNQASAFQNGVYTVTTAGSGSAAWVLTRASYFNSAAAMKQGSYTFITAGSANINTSWTLQTAITTCGTDSLNWVQFSSGSSGTVTSITAGTGLTGGTITSSGTVAVDYTHNNTWTGTNTFNGDTFNSTGSPDCNVVAKGAVHDGSTDDSAAFNACVTQCITTKSFGACVIFVPPAPSAYCIKSTINLTTGLTTNGGFRFIGGGVQGTILDACGTNTNILNLNAQWIEFAYMTVLGYGSHSTDNVFTGTPPSQPTVLLQSDCSNCHLHDDYITGGTAAIQNNGACGYNIDSVWGSFSYGDGSHVFGFFTQINCGGTIWNDHFDMIYPVCQPTHGSTIAAWQANHAYSTATCTTVTVTCNSRTFYIQLKTSGTSGGSQPTCAPFGTNITDNTAVWLLLNATTSYCVQVDTGSIETEILQTDMTCAAQYNLGFTNTYAGVGPTQNRVSLSTPGGGISGNILVNSGTHLTLVNMETSFCMLTGCAGLVLNSTAVANTAIDGIDCLNGLTYCVYLAAAASDTMVSQMRSTGADTADFNVAAAAIGFQLTNSIHISGAANLFTVGAVAADHYYIGGNICNGASSSDSGSGSHKAVTTCASSAP